MKIFIKRFLFYSIAGFIIASLNYYLLEALNLEAFGTLYRMFNYHHEKPLGYIAIACLFYGLFAAAFVNLTARKSGFSQILVVLLIVSLTIFVSSIFGGMLWYYYDMQAGYFPAHWLERIIFEGAKTGYMVGWLVIALSIPYNIFGIIICYFLTIFGAGLFQERK